MRRFMLAAAAAAVMAASLAAAAQNSFGTRAEAEAMLEKAVAAVKVDKAKALEMINQGKDGFLDRDLYPFCFDAVDGKVVAIANPNAKSLLGKDERTLKDAAGTNYGQALYDAAQKPEGEISEVGYLFPKPGADATPVPKVSFVTRVDGLGCAAGYYK